VSEKQLPVVAVIVPLHNHENFIERAIRSAAEQDYPAKFIVVIDDGSTDNSYSVVYSLLENRQEKSNEGGVIISGDVSNTRVFLLKHDLALGPSAARNSAIEFAWKTAHLFSMMDADDYYLPTKISKSVAKFLEYPNEIGIVYTNAIIHSEITGVDIEEFREAYDDRRLCQECIISNTAMISRLAFERCGLYDKTYRTAEDWNLYLRICEKFIAVNIPECLHVYSVTGVNASNIVNQEVWQKNWARIGQYLQQRGRH